MKLQLSRISSLILLTSSTITQSAYAGLIEISFNESFSRSGYTSTYVGSLVYDEANLVTDSHGDRSVTQLESFEVIYDAPNLIVDLQGPEDIPLAGLTSVFSSDDPGTSSVSFFWNLDAFLLTFSAENSASGITHGGENTNPKGSSIYVSTLDGDISINVEDYNNYGEDLSETNLVGFFPLEVTPIAEVPLPSTLWLLISGVLGLATLARRAG